MYLIDKLDKGGDGSIADDLVGKCEAIAVKDCASAMSCFYIRMRLVDDVGVQIRFSGIPEELEIGAGTEAGGHRAIIFDLPDHEQVPSGVTALQWNIAGSVLADPKFDD